MLKKLKWQTDNVVYQRITNHIYANNLKRGAIVWRLFKSNLKFSDFSIFQKFRPENCKKFADCPGEKSTDSKFETTKLKLHANKNSSSRPTS